MKLHGYCFMVYHTDNEIAFFYIKSWNTFANYVYLRSKKELNYDRFVDPKILVDPKIRGASCLVHSDPLIYRISFFLLDLIPAKQRFVNVSARAQFYQCFFLRCLSESS